MTFQKTKFERLELKQKHKKCALVLREIYEKLLVRDDDIALLKETYFTYCKWMHLDPFPQLHDAKLLSDRYHWHLSQAHIQLKEHNLLPHIRKGDHIPKTNFSNIAIYLDNVRSAYNVGSILRTTEALRIGSIYFAEKTPFIDNSKVQKTSMGSSEIVPCFQEFSLENLPRPFIALETSEDAENVTDFIFPKAFTLILGNEEFGISDKMLSMVDHLVEIPLFGKKNSINIACAYSIAANEIRRQHTFGIL